MAAAVEGESPTGDMRLLPIRRASRLLLVFVTFSFAMAALQYVLTPPPHWSGQDAEFRLRVRTASSVPAQLDEVWLNERAVPLTALNTTLPNWGVLRFRARGEAVMLLTIRLRLEGSDGQDMAERLITPLLGRECAIEVYAARGSLLISPCMVVGDSDWD